MAKKRKKKASEFRLHLIFLSLNCVIALAILGLGGFLIMNHLVVKPVHSQETMKGFDEYREETEENSPVLGAQNSDAIILHGNRSKKEIAITFDAEMTYGMRDAFTSGSVKSSYDKRIIDTLIATKTPATLFLTGMWAQLYPDVTKALAKNSLFEIGSHSYIDSAYAGDCYGLQPTPHNEELEELESTQKILHDLTGKDPTLFRFPGGCYDDYAINTVTNIVGLKIVHWDVVGGDGFNDNTQSIIDGVSRQTQNGSIIVLHMNGAPTAPKTADALPAIINNLKQKGFTFVKVSQLLGL